MRKQQRSATFSTSLRIASHRIALCVLVLGPPCLGPLSQAGRHAGRQASLLFVCQFHQLAQSRCFCRMRNEKCAIFNCLIRPSERGDVGGCSNAVHSLDMGQNWCGPCPSERLLEMHRTNCNACCESVRLVIEISNSEIKLIFKQN